MRLFHSKGYKVFSGYIYGWGASCVIIGALFKIMHFPYAGIILTVGMVVEAFIFFVSAFEPQMEHYDWSRVFPQLGRNKIDAANQPAVAGNMMTGGISAVGLEQKDADDLKRGICKIAETADALANVVEKAPDVGRNMERISDSFEHLNDRTRKVGEALENSARELTHGCTEMNRLVTDSARELSEKIRMNTEKMMQSMMLAGEQCAVLGGVIDEQAQQVKNGMHSFVQGNIRINENIAALNALYEIQVKDTKEGLEVFRKMHQETDKVLKHVAESSGSTSRFKEETQQLAEKVSSLNSVYGNMLSLINNN